MWAFPFVSCVGAGNGIRTRDIQLGRLTLYQLSYSRGLLVFCPEVGGGRRIRTFEGVSRQIYSLLPLAARASLLGSGFGLCSLGEFKPLTALPPWNALRSRQGATRVSPWTPTRSVSANLPAASPQHPAASARSSDARKKGPAGWSWRRESDPRPPAYKAGALPAELRQPNRSILLPCFRQKETPIQRRESPCRGFRPPCQVAGGTASNRADARSPATDVHREPARAPPAGVPLEDAWNAGAATRATAFLQRPGGEPVPVAADHRLPAPGAVRGPAALVVDVAGIDVAKPVAEPDLARSRQGRRRRGRPVEHLEVGVEGREVQRHVRAELAVHPARERVDLGGRIVLAGDEERRDLQPDLRVSPQVPQGVEDRIEVAEAHAPVEVLREPLEVDVRRIDVPVELPPGLVADVPCRDRYRLDAPLPAGLRRVDRVLEEDGGVVVGERDAAAAQLLRLAGDLLRSRCVGEDVHLARLRHVPVLAETAAQVAAGRTKGQDAGSGEEVVERLLLDRVHAEAAGAAVRSEHHPIAFARADEAEPALPLMERAVPGADVALDPPVGQAMKVAAFEAHALFS